ncbi:SUN domain-containing ossification factor-like isoform X2 [Patiria miniata]|uniref:SUN domain-containing protein n=1 Tax=Patiria miniata TaxID=46514 RepID=A0A913Z294_PATMI|nr:SUN domain-containing ossification factor-like isoform X2 [Patiria miniata]
MCTAKVAERLRSCDLEHMPDHICHKDVGIGAMYPRSTFRLWETMHLLLVLCLMIAAYLGAVYRQRLNMTDELHVVPVEDVPPETANYSDELMDGRMHVHIPTDQQQAISNSEQFENPDKLQDNLETPLAKSDSPNEKTTEIENMDATDEIPKLDVENVGNVAETDTRAQQIERKVATDNIESDVPAKTTESQEAVGEAKPLSDMEEEAKQDVPEPPPQAELSDKTAPVAKDPGTDSVDGTSVGQDQDSKDNLPAGDTPEIIKKKPEDSSPEEPKEPKEEIPAVDKDDSVKRVEEEKVVEKLEEADEKPDLPHKDEEEMPSFDEWKQKMLEQHEQERQNGQAGKGSAVPPPRSFSLTENSKNHATSDCGAKILNCNKESQNAPAILQSNRDVYTLNPCSANIWFSVELCEPIQVKYLEIANYELFSSVPKSFRVSISDRFPTREWRQLGTFHAREERSLQSFPVHEEQMFAKYMKIEMLTFFGNEHYCPLSTLRVFGTSMVEEIDEENVAQETIQDDSEVLPAHPTQAPSDDNHGLLQSAKGLVRNLMNVITGNGSVKEAVPCNNKNKSCTEAEEMLPCMPEDKPKELQSEPSNVSATAEQESLQCNSQNMSNFSLDSAQFHKECPGSTRCFTPNYGEKFQDCCVREVSASLQTTHSFLCCKDMLSVSLLRSAQTLEPSKVQKDSIGSPKEVEQASQKKEQTKSVVDDLDVQSQKKTSEETSEQKLDSDKDQIRRKEIVLESLEISPSGATVSKTTPSEKHKHSESKETPTSTTSPQPMATAEAGNMLPSPTPSLKATCATVPTHQPGIMLHPPIRLEPTRVQEEAEQRDRESPEQLPPSKSPAVDKETPAPPAKVENLKPEEPSPATDSSPAGGKDDSAQVKEKSTEVSGESHEKAPVEEAAPTELQAPVADTGIASKDSADARKPDPAVPQDKSRQADATEKDPGKTGEAEDTRKSLKTETKETAEVESVSKTPENAKSETAGKGTKTVPELGTNGSSGLGSVAQKESVFMRLNNRIKSLELNMSLSSRYLEELSQRYRKRMDDMQKAFNKTVQTLTENAQKAEEKDQRQQEYITRLEGQMSEVMMNLEATNQRLDGLHKEVAERHLFFLFIEIVLMSFIFLICIRRVRRGRSIASHSTPFVVRSHDNGIRRNSHPSVSEKKGLEYENRTPPRVGQRTISGGSCDDLLIIGPSTPFLESLKQVNEPPRQKPKNKAKHKPTKSISNSALQQSHQPTVPPKRASKMTAAGVLFRGSAFSGGRTPPDSPTDPVHRTVSAEEINGRVQDISRGAPPMRQQQQQQQQRPKVGGRNVVKKHGLMVNGRR